MHTLPAFTVDARHVLQAAAGTPPVAHDLLSPNHGGPLRHPRLIVLHYTAGHSAEGSARWLCDGGAKASAHLVVGRGGKVWQIVNLGTQAWHAGRSAWGDLKMLNLHSIGIEMANLGCDPQAARLEPSRRVRARHPHGGPERTWERYPAHQVATVAALCAALMHRYPAIGLMDIIGHDDCAPGRKTDPGPAWDWTGFRTQLTAALNLQPKTAAT